MNTEYHNSRLHVCKKVWHEKPVLQRVYKKWYSWITADRAAIEGPVVEIGSGIGNFKEFSPDTISTDISPQPWLDCVCDAQALSFKQGRVSTFVLVDVLHHLSAPMDFFRAAVDILPPRGRIILLEPYPTLFSRFVYSLFHEEPFLFSEPVLTQSMDGAKEPWQSNQAIAYLLFRKHLKAFHETLGHSITLKKWQLSDCLYYPLTGGFDHPSLIPVWLFPIIQCIETLLTPFRRLCAFRCYSVWEKSAPPVSNE